MPSSSTHSTHAEHTLLRAYISAYISLHNSALHLLPLLTPHFGILLELGVHQLENAIRSEEGKDLIQGELKLYREVKAEGWMLAKRAGEVIGDALVEVGGRFEGEAVQDMWEFVRRCEEWGEGLRVGGGSFDEQ